MSECEEHFTHDTKKGQVIKPALDIHHEDWLSANNHHFLGDYFSSMLNDYCVHTLWF